MAIRDLVAGAGITVLPTGNAGEGKLEWQKNSAPQVLVPGDTTSPVQRAPSRDKTPRPPTAGSRAARTRQRQGWKMAALAVISLVAIAGTGTWLTGGFDTFSSSPRPGVATPPASTPATPAPTAPAPVKARPGVVDGAFTLETSRGTLMTMQDLLGALGARGLNNLVADPRPMAQARGVAAFDRRQPIDVLAVAALANGWQIDRQGDLFRISAGTSPPAERLKASRATLAPESLPMISVNTHSDSRYTVRQVLAALSKDHGIDYLVVGASLPEVDVPSLSLTRQPISTLMDALAGSASFAWTWEKGTLVMIELPR
jgi:hypothetical protein